MEALGRVLLQELEESGLRRLLRHLRRRIGGCRGGDGDERRHGGYELQSLQKGWEGMEALGRVLLQELEESGLRRLLRRLRRRIGVCRGGDGDERRHGGYELQSLQKGWEGMEALGRVLLQELEESELRVLLRRLRRRIGVCRGGDGDERRHGGYELQSLQKGWEGMEAL